MSTGNQEMLTLADGREVPAAAVRALDDLERKWPGASLAQARPAIVAAVLAAVAKTGGSNP
ncbi:hypothetical protein [Nocardia vulneris]|uniref:hypothetical protein n=1 Tax=Nocardia vulneris TaxID=1141657 RepID=UPI000B306898|nr:hypothetical protein [Nocardia vulneris]